MSRARENRRKNSRLNFSLVRNPAYIWACPDIASHQPTHACGLCAHRPAAAAASSSGRMYP